MIHSSQFKQNGTSLTSIAIAWLITIAFITFGFQWYLDRQNNPNQALSSNISGQSQTEITLLRNRQGHYVAPGFINGQPVDFLIDTGATRVAIPGSVAKRLNLSKGIESASLTAGGVVPSYLIRLSNVQLGSLTQTNVSGAVVPSMPGDQVLLGMSFLKHYKLLQSNETLMISP